MCRYISEPVKRRLYAESMGRCMNPKCCKELFSVHGDLIEKAHIDPYCDSADNSFENLVILCPNCHTEFDKNRAFNAQEVLGWKQKRREDLINFFSTKYNNFISLKQMVAPLLDENKQIYEQYYLKNNKRLWDKFEGRILVNNKKLQILLSSNLDLFQRDQKNRSHSNIEIINQFLLHIQEFENTRSDEDKNRQVLFPAEVNSIFGIAPVKNEFMPLTESFEELIAILNNQDGQANFYFDGNVVYIKLIKEGNDERIYLDDAPRMRQLLYDYHCFKKAKVRFESLNFAFKYIWKHNLNIKFPKFNNLREIVINDKINMIFVYEYCLSKVQLIEYCDTINDNVVIINLHNWNGNSCISREAYEWAKAQNVTLLNMDEFYDYVKRIV